MMVKDYDTCTDEELIARLRAGEREITDYLIDKYKSLVRTRARALYLVGGDHEDLIQEGMLGLFKAVRDYKPGKEASFATFAGLCRLGFGNGCRLRLAGRLCLAHRFRLTHGFGLTLHGADRIDQCRAGWLAIGLAGRLGLAWLIGRLLGAGLGAAFDSWGRAGRAAIIEILRGRLAAHDGIEFAERFDLLGHDAAHGCGAGAGFLG